MKKLLLVILALMLVFGLGACNSASTEDYATKSELELLEIEIQAFQEQMDAIQERIDNLTITTGLNGVVSVYENETLKDKLNMQLVTLSLQMMVVKDTFDKNKTSPEYIKDEFGGYVSFADLGALLQTKYFNESTLSSYTIFEMGSKAYLQFSLDNEHTADELFAQTVLLIEEIRNYSFYVLSCNELEIYIMWHNADNSESYRMSITIPLVVIINDYFEITLNGIYEGDFETKLWLHEVSINEINAQLIYDSYVLDETYSGFVLNFTK